MKKRLSAIIFMLTFFISTALAANTYKTNIEIEYGIDIKVDGSRRLWADANGNEVQPFVYNGTTFVPLRAVADVLGIAVSYDSANNIAYLNDYAKEAKNTLYEIRIASNAVDRSSFVLYKDIKIGRYDATGFDDARNTSDMMMENVDLYMSNMRDNNNVFLSLVEPCYKLLQNQVVALNSAISNGYLSIKMADSSYLTACVNDLISQEKSYFSCINQCDTTYHRFG